MNVICYPVATFANKYRAFACLLLLKSPTSVMLAHRPKNTAAKHRELAAVVPLTHCLPCAGWRPSRASPPAVRCRPFRVAHVNLRPQLCLAPVKPQKNRGQGRSCFFLLGCDFFEVKWPSWFCGWSCTSFDLWGQNCQQHGGGVRSSAAKCLNDCTWRRMMKACRLWFCCSGADSNCWWHLISL